MKLSVKIISITLQLALIPWIVGGYIAYLSAQEQSTSQAFTSLNALADIQKDRLLDTLQNKSDILHLFTMSPWLIADIKAINQSPTLASKKSLQDLIEAPGRSLGIRYLFVATPAGIVVASTNSALLNTNISAEQYFKRGLLHDDLSTLKKDADGTISQFLAGPLIADGVAEGVAVVVTDADDVVGISNDYSGLGDTGETLLVATTSTEDVTFLTPTRFSKNAALSLTIKTSQIGIPETRAAKGEEKIFSTLVDYRNEPVFAATRYIDSVGWGIVVKIDQTEALAPMKKLSELFVLIVALVVIALILISVSMARSITRPINTLTRLAKKISEGSAPQRSVITLKSEDEVGLLAAAFNDMTLKLYEANVLLEQKVAERTRELEEKTREAENSGKAAMNIAADLKREEEKLVEEKTRAEVLAGDLEKFKMALDDTSDQVIITDPEGMVVYANAAVERITGYAPAEVIGKKSGALWKAPMPKEYYQNLWHTIKDKKETFIGEIQNRRKNGELYTALISISPVFNNEGVVIFFAGIERDITKEKQMDQAKSEFISLASHQMRTPLTAISWYTEMLLGGDAGKLSKKQKEYFNEIYVASRRMNEIIKAFLHILRLETGTIVTNPVLIDLVDIVKSTIKESQLDIEKRHLKITERYQESLPPLKADTELVRVVLQNLISNAVKYTSEGGEMTVSLETVEKGTVVGGRTADRNSLVISVRDTGIGISADDRKKVFDKFFRSETAKRWDPNGNGLGLYMTRKMVDIIGGTIWFESEEGKGTTFYVLFPMNGGKPV